MNLLQNLIKSCKRKRLLRAKKFIIVMFSKKNNSQIKRLFSFIIVCFLKNTSTIQSLREIKRRNRFILWDFHYVHQDFIAARQKNLEFDSDYNFFFKLFSYICYKYTPQGFNHFESILSKVHFRLFKRYRFFWFKSSWIVINFI
jgi:hypothetical protein